MITEDYVSFETAKLLKEKGFVPLLNYKDWVCCMYALDGEIHWGVYSDEWYPRITLQMAMKWLREIQALNIYARPVWKDVEVQYGDWEPAVVGYGWFVESLLDDTYSKMSPEPFLFLTYEEACEAAIKYCLENLI